MKIAKNNVKKNFIYFMQVSFGALLLGVSLTLLAIIAIGIVPAILMGFSPISKGVAVAISCITLLPLGVATIALFLSPVTEMILGLSEDE